MRLADVGLNNSQLLEAFKAGSEPIAICEPCMALVAQTRCRMNDGGGLFILATSWEECAYL